jgi:hypothetical protein
MIISGGENIYSREVEESLLRHVAVAECAVIGVPDLKWGETVCALVVLRTGQPVPTAAELIEFSKYQIASYKKPKQVVFIERLPKLVTGKVDKKLLREQYAGQDFSQPLTMNLQMDAGIASVRQEVREFLRAKLPADVVRRTRIGMHPPHNDDRQWWNRVLNEQGWSAPAWPREYGGTGWTPLQQHVFERECRLAHAPEVRWQGLKLIGPVIYAFGTAEQKARYLPPILSGRRDSRSRVPARIWRL